MFAAYQDGGMLIFRQMMEIVGFAVFMASTISCIAFVVWYIREE